MSHRWLPFVALGAATLLAAAPAQAAPPPPEVRLPNLRIAEADAADGAVQVINVALDGAEPVPVPDLGRRG